MATKKQILESDELLQQKKRAYHLSDSCQLIQFIRHDNFQRPYFVGFGRQNSTTILHGILINAYICIHS